MMVALVPYAYATGTRSSRQIERRLIEDVAVRVIGAGQCPDHATIARFRARHAEALCGRFSEVLALCAKASLVRPGTLALDSTKLDANASEPANMSDEEIARAILAEAAATDAAEDERFGERRGDELPEGLRSWRERRDWLRRARQELEAEREHPGRSREARLAEAERRLQEQHEFERHAVEAAQAASANRAAEQRARGRKPTGRRRIHPLVVPDEPSGRVNVTDPDSRPVKTTRGIIQGYSAKAAATEDQVIVMADVTVGGPDQGKLAPLAERALAELERAGADPPQVLRADAGYWNGPQIESLRERGIDALVAPDRQIKRGPPARRPQAPLAAELHKRLDTDEGRALYRRTSPPAGGRAGMSAPGEYSALHQRGTLITPCTERMPAKVATRSHRYGW
jgi:Transposase domain (DUF772)